MNQIQYNYNINYYNILIFIGAIVSVNAINIVNLNHRNLSYERILGLW